MGKLKNLKKLEKGVITSITSITSLMRKFSKSKTYRTMINYSIVKRSVNANLMEQMTKAVVHPELFHSRQLLRRVSSQYDIHSDDLGTRLLAVIDYVSGMTDIYALDIYQKINGISLPIV